MTEKEEPRWRFYVATDFYRKEEARALADRLSESSGGLLGVNARWVTSQPVTLAEGLGGELEGESAEAARRVAGEDLDDIRSSDIFIHLTNGEKKRGGNHVELGYALSYAQDHGTVVVACGPREHAFHYFELVNHVKDVDELVTWFDGWLTGRS